MPKTGSYEHKKYEIISNGKHHKEFIKMHSYFVYIRFLFRYLKIQQISWNFNVINFNIIRRVITITPPETANFSKNTAWRLQRPQITPTK